MLSLFRNPIVVHEGQITFSAEICLRLGLYDGIRIQSVLIEQIRPAHGMAIPVGQRIVIPPAAKARRNSENASAKLRGAVRFRRQASKSLALISAATIRLRL